MTTVMYAASLMTIKKRCLLWNFQTIKRWQLLMQQSTIAEPDPKDPLFVQENLSGADGKTVI